MNAKVIWACTLVAVLQTGLGVASACDQRVAEISAQRDEKYSVNVTYIDNRIEIHVSNSRFPDRVILNAAGNGEFDIKQDLTEYLTPGDNTLSCLLYTSRCV